MAFFSEDELGLLGIDKFIFHVVHHGGDQPILFGETPIGGFEPFFLARVRDTLRGNRFVFLDGSVTRAALKQVADDPDRFVEVSKTLALAFGSEARTSG
jgi:hypothetical protein